MRRDVVKALLSSFVSDKDSSNPIGERSPYIGKRIRSLSEVSALELSRAFILIEPWPSVGMHPKDRQAVYAGENVAYLIDQMTSASTLIVPAWEYGIGDPLVFAAAARASLGVIIEGGDPDVHSEESFHPNFTRAAATALMIEMMLNEVPFLGICLAHQIVAQAHIELIKVATRHLIQSRKTSFINIGRKIEEMGLNLSVLKSYGTVALSWNDRRFAVAPNDASSHHLMKLFAYEQRELKHVPSELTEAHRYVSQLHTATIDTILRYNTLRVQTFHSNEVSEEAVRFICWAYQLIHHLTVAYRTEIAKDPELNYLLSMPLGIEATSSTRFTEHEETFCQVASTAIYWLDRTAQTTQFHPELDTTLLTVSRGWAPSWKEMKQSEGIQLFARLLRELVK